jgi:glycerol-3-phosphate dehydrogenase
VKIDLEDRQTLVQTQRRGGRRDTEDHLDSKPMQPSLSTSRFDVIIIGAGINGAGIARDAAMRGLKVLLLDKGDIGSGTSSASTRLIHGGLRYLEHAEFGLVRESLRERENLIRIAPHLVRPVPILIPIYKDRSRGLKIIRAGMLAYDLLSYDKTLPRHRMLSRFETLERCGGLNQEALVGGALYYDCQVEFAERLVLENALSAKECGAEILTYAGVTKLREGEVQFRKGTDEQTVQAPVTINAAGPWVDRINSDEQRSPLIGGTKGSHIIVRSFSGSPATAVYIEAETDHRPFFIIPWNHNYLIGTTDVRFKGDLDDVASEMWEVDYLLKETNRAFPDAKLGREDICYTYSGVRPLPFTKNEHEQGITRRHFIRPHSQIRNVFSVVGGKLTTYRGLAEECVDLVFQKLRKRSPRCETSKIPLPGATNFSLELSLEFDTAVAERISRIYGGKQCELARLCERDDALAKTFNKAGDAIAAEVVFSFESELAETLADCLLRRTMLGLNCDLGIDDAVAAAQIAQQFLGWSEKRVSDELAEYRREIEKRMLR